MKLFLILMGVAAACFFGYSSFSNIIHPADPPAKAAPAVLAPVEAKPSIPTPPAPGPFQDPANPIIPPPGDPNANLPPVALETVLVHIFKNRPAPPPPFGRNQNTVGSGKDSDGLELSVDAGSNSWIMRGPPEAVQQVSKIAEYLDVTQDELDLDFLLVTVSETWLRSFGISAAYQEGAAWLPSFTLGTSGSTLRIASNGFAVDLNASQSDSSASVYSSPVVRVVTGERWAFGSDREIPIQSTVRQDGLQQDSYAYRKVGLGFSGVCTKAGPQGSYRLEVEQRNGDTENNSPTVDGVPPVIRSQLLQTALVVEVGRWSCVGGVSSWRKEQKKRLLGRSESEEQNLLLVFVRARDALSVAPQAYPVGDGPDHMDPFTTNAWDLAPDESGLLPPRDWKDEERKFLKAKAAK